MSGYVLETEDLEKKFKGFSANNKINLKIKEKTIYGLVGENGAGKSTLMRMLAGLSNKTGGTIKLFGKEIERESEEFKNVGNLIEAPALYPKLSAYENLKLKCMAYDIKDTDRQIREILELVGLEKTGKKKVKNFSLGMKQRLGIAMALLGFPKILILDEPINGLDPQGIIDIRNTIKEINQRYGITIIISSHILDELSKIATEFGIISKGSLISEFTLDELHKNCSSQIEIITKDAKKASKVLEDNGYMHSLVNENKLILKDYFEKTNTINRLLIDSGIDVESISVKETSFEDYYLEILNNEKSN